MKFLLSLFRYYFFFTGLMIHLVAVGLFVVKPPIYQKLVKATEQKLRKENPQAADSLFGKIKVYSLSDDLKAAIPPWYPLETASTAPRSGNIVWSHHFSSLQQAADTLQPGDTLRISEGVYKKGFVVQTRQVLIEGIGHVVLDDAAIKDKGAIITQGDAIEVRNIECRNIKVGSGNGACIRHEGRKLKVSHVYFHDSQEGILSGGDHTAIEINDSWFIGLGYGGQAHGIYVAGKELSIINSFIVASKEEGHQIKSRAKKTTIDSSVIASLSAKDSRLIDASNGGELIIKNSTLQQGPLSVNQVAIGYGLEGMTFQNNNIELENNLIILEREGVNKLFHLQNDQTPIVTQHNVVVASETIELAGPNLWFKNRKDAELAEYPALPRR